MKPIDLTLITELHRVYCQFTGLSLALKFNEYSRERAWGEYIRAGFTLEDLRMVLIYLKRGIHREERRRGCLRFRNLIDNLDCFEEELALAKAHLRNNRPQSNREEIIQAFRPEVVPELKGACLPAKEVMKRLIEEMKKAAS